MTKTYTDHLGNTFPTISDMAKHHNISRAALVERLQKNMPIKEALTKPVQKRKNEYVDHLGNIFHDIGDMARYHNINEPTLRGRLRKNMSIEEALTTPVKKQKQNNEPYKDHLGNVFPNLNCMAKHYHICRKTLELRLQKGMSIKEALTTPVKKRKNQNIYTDHLGNNFRSVKAMAEYHNINEQTLKNRLRKGMSIKDALTTPIKDQRKTYTDFIGNTFHDVKTMAEHYNISKYNLDNRLKSMSSTYTTIAQILNITPSNKQLSKFRIDNSDYYLYEIDGKKAVVTFDQIDQYHIEKYRKEHNIV